MKKEHIGILHPGSMGISVAATMQNSGFEVYWASAGRSPATSERAEKHRLKDAVTLAGLCDRCSVIVSVCPPHAAENLAQEVQMLGFSGLYIDANAISPTRAKRIGLAMTQAGITFVDGGIIGGPAWEPDRTWLYLSGERASEVEQFFAAGPLETTVLGKDVGRASALKMCYAAYTKGTTALLCAILATAQQLGVGESLRRQWSRNESDFALQADRRVGAVPAKAWRFVAEMEEIAATFEAAGLPGDFHLGAAKIYRRLAGYQGTAGSLSLEDVLQILITSV